MSWQSTPYLLVLFIAAIGSVLVGSYTIIHTRARGRKAYHTAFLFLCFGAALWSAAYAVQLASTDLETKRLAYTILHFGVGTVAPAWLIFSLSYTGRARLLTPPVVGLISAIPVALILTLPTNPGSLALTSVSLETHDGFVRLATGNGPVYQLFLAYTYVVIPLGGAMIVHHTLTTSRYLRRQATLLVAGALIPLVVNIIHVLGLPPLASVSVNLTPVSVAAAAVLIGGAISNYQLLSVTPIARKAVFENMREGVIVLNERNEIIDYNPAAATILEHPTGLEGTPITTVLPAYEEVAAGAETASLTLTSGENEQHLELTRSRLEQDGTQHGWVVLLYDVTTREATQTALERQNRRLDTFTKVVSHDLKNPLSMISGYSQLARETGEDSHLETVEETVAEMDTFLTELRTLAEAGQTVGECQPIQIGTLLEEVRQTLPRDSRLTIDQRADAVVLADRTRLKQVLDNLLRNALDHGEEQVTVEIGRLEDGIYFEDDGPGIEATDREAIFEYGVTTRTEGSGFGLGIVRDIVEAHGWQIAVQTGKTGGARFELTGLEFAAERDTTLEGDSVGRRS